MKTSFSEIRRQLARPNAELFCAAISLDAAVQGDSLVRGPGKFRFTDDGQIRFELQARLTPEQAAELHRNHIVYGWRLSGLQLSALGYDDSRYTASISEARFAQPNLTNYADVRVVGTLRCLQTDVTLPSGQPRAVVVYTQPPHVPLTTWRTTEVSHAESQELLSRSVAGHKFTTKGTEVSVVLSSEGDELELAAIAGEGAYGHPYLEHLLAEPFRALNGTNQFPRYILRDFGNGSGFLTIAPQPKSEASLGGASSTFSLINPAGYWGYFSKYLDFLAAKYDERFYADPNQLTLYHDEVNRAVDGGSYWVVSLALSSGVEGLCRKHPEWKPRLSPVTAAEREQAEALLAALPSDFLREKLSSALNSACVDQKPSCTPVLKVLTATGAIEARHKNAWEKFRHYVMHGNLLDHREPDSRLNVFPDLYELFQLLTAQMIGFSTADHPLNPAERQLLEAFEQSRRHP